MSVEISYGVEVRDDPADEWRVRFGWFPEQSPWDGEGLERARDNLRWFEAFASPGEARIVKRTSTVEVVEE